MKNRKILAFLMAILMVCSSFLTACSVVELLPSEIIEFIEAIEENLGNESTGNPGNDTQNPENEDLPAPGDDNQNSEHEDLPASGEDNQNPENEDLPVPGDDNQNSENEDLPTPGDDNQDSEHEDLPAPGDDNQNSENEDLPPLGGDSPSFDDEEPDDQPDESELEKGSLEYALNPDGKSYAVVGIGTYVDENVVIPVTYKGLPVTVIEHGAFASNSTIVSVTIPEGITFINWRAFYNCKSLKTVKLPETLLSVAEDVFQYSSNVKYNVYDGVNYLGNEKNPYLLLVKASNQRLEEHKVHDDTKVIAAEAFKDCSSLMSVSMSDSVIGIGHSAFRGCKALERIILSKNITKLNSSVFLACSALTQITIPDKVTDIATFAFEACNSLTEIFIPDSVKRIEYGAFSGSANLKTARVPSGIEYIGPKVFDGCALSYTQIGNGLFLGNESTPGVVLIGLVDTGVSSYEIPSSVKVIYDYALYYCIELTKINIPASVISIGDYAFGECFKLSEVTLPNTVMSIGEGAFSSCALTTITLPEGMTKVSNYLLKDCSRLTTVIIPDSVTEIGKYAFKNCKALTTIQMSEEIIDFIDNAIEGCKSLVYTEYENGKYLGNAKNPYLVFCHVIDETVETLNIHSSTKVILGEAAAHCRNLKSVNIPEGITSILSEAFYNSAITELVIPSTVTFMDGYALHMCEKLEKITYMGTIDQFRLACENGGATSQYLCGSVGTYTIHCSDGDYTIKD